MMKRMLAKKKKAGRPVKAVRKEVRASIRFTRPEYFVIREKAAKAGLTAAAYIRQIAIHATVTTRLTEEERHFIRQLIGLSNNINQLAKTVHKEGLLSALYHFEGYRKQLDELLNRLKDAE